MEWPVSMTAYKGAVITGASRGVGAGPVTAYRRQGWAVTASADAIRPSGDDDLLAVPGDITEPAAGARVGDAALDRFGRIDTLVNNASTVISRPFTDYTAADFATVMGASGAGFFWLTQRTMAEMAVRYGGHVVTVSATVAPAAPSGTPSVLAALASGGIAAATRSLAVEYAACGIRVNAVSAGLIQTPVTPAAPVVTGHHRGVGAALVDETADVVGQLADVVGGDAPPLPRKVVGPRVRCDEADPRLRERLDLLPPGVPELGEPVQQDDERSLAGLDVVQPLVAYLGVTLTKITGQRGHVGLLRWLVCLTIAL